MSFTVTESAKSYNIDLAEATSWEKRLVRAKIEELQATIQAMYDLSGGKQ